MRSLRAFYLSRALVTWIRIWKFEIKNWNFLNFWKYLLHFFETVSHFRSLEREFSTDFMPKVLKCRWVISKPYRSARITARIRVVEHYTNLCKTSASNKKNVFIAEYYLSQCILSSLHAVKIILKTSLQKF